MAYFPLNSKVIYTTEILLCGNVTAVSRSQSMFYMAMYVYVTDFMSL